MNKEVEQMDALMGGGTTTPAAAQPTAQEEFERTRHELDVARGRLKARDGRVKELEKELAELRARTQQEDLVSKALTPEERERLDPSFISAAAKIASESENRIRREQEERDQRAIEEREADVQRRKADFSRRVEERFPGFMSSVGAGGEKSAAWTEFMHFNGPSVNAAYARFDLETVAYFISQFDSWYKSKFGIRVPSGSQGKATSPDPRNLGSGAQPVQQDDSKKVYTSEEYDAIEKKALAARRRGDWDEYRKLNDKLNDILAEGRVKD